MPIVSIARYLNKASEFHPVEGPDTHPTLIVAGVPVVVYVEPDGRNGLRLRVSVHFDDAVDPRLIDHDGTVRTTVTFNGEPQDTYDRSTGTRTTN